MHCGSYTWEPIKHYITPQCGEYEEHQLILDGFADINRKNVKEQKED